MSTLYDAKLVIFTLNSKKTGIKKGKIENLTLFLFPITLFYVTLSVELNILSHEIYIIKHRSKQSVAILI